MKPTEAQNGSAPAPGAKSDAQKNLKSVPMEELQKKLGSSPDGLSQAEAQKRLAQYGPNEIAEKKDNPFLKFLSYFWGPIPWMIEGAVILSGVVRHWPDFFIILLLLGVQRRRRILGRTPGGRCDRRTPEAVGDQSQSQTRREMDRSFSEGSGAGRRHPPETGRHRSSRRAPAARRPGGGGPVRADRRIFTRRKKSRAMRYSPAPSFARAKSKRWCTPPVPTPTSARPRKWCRARNPPAISRKPC